MRISKHLHSCLLIENQGKTILIDPGIFTYQEKALDINALTKLDYILITHEHFDHVSVPLVKELLAKFPQVVIITNPSAATLLKGEDIHAQTEGTDFIKIKEVKHERVFDHKPPQNIMFVLFNRLTHPGDSMNFPTTREILALPLLGPSWMVTQAAEKALSLRPKFIIPIHDHHFRDDYRKQFYTRFEEFFAKEAIEFKPMETGEIIEI